MTFTQAVKAVFANYATFSGRASRTEFWWWSLFAFLSNLVLEVVPPVAMAWALVITLPNLAVTARRLHDTDRSGWWMLAPYGVALVAGLLAAVRAWPLFLIAVALGFVMLVVLVVWLATRGTDGANRFGPDPMA